MAPELGKIYEYKRTVKTEDLASSIGSGGQDVLATPVMICWMEIASVLCLDIEDESLCSLGVNVNVDHIAATPLGSEITVRSKLTLLEERRATFEVEAFDETERIGCGTHVRAITKKERFMARVSEKAKK